MLRRLAIGLTIVLLVGIAAGSLPAGLASGSSPLPDTTGQPPVQTTPDGFTNTVFEIRLSLNSSARWTVRHSTPLPNETEREQFETYAERFTTETTDAYADFRTRAQRLTAFGANATGRGMAATGFSRDARVEERFAGTRGVIELSFLWTNFSQERANAVVAGDVFEGGMYISSDQRLVVSRGDDARFVEMPEPTPDSLAVSGNVTASETVTWFADSDGRQFADSRPRVVLTDRNRLDDAGGTGSTSVAGTTTEAGMETQTSTDPSEGQSSSRFGPLAFVVAVLLLVGLGGSIAWYSGALPEIVAGSDNDSEELTEGVSPAETPEQPEPAVPDEELLSDEDRVLELLEQNGGRMKQVNIVSETDWSKSKVSMLLSEMEDEGEISKLRVGRENIISLSGEEPDAVGSPFDDE